MTNSISKVSFIIFGGIFCLILFFSGLSAQKEIKQNQAEESLRLFLNNWDEDISDQYTANFYDLNDDGIPEAILYLTGNQWCGSGGCTLLILQRAEKSWRVISQITICRPPIRVLTEVSNGWHDISVWVQGGGIQPGYEAKLTFDGKTYPKNPTVSPARPLTGKSSGLVIIDRKGE
jgi:hypothetical protein